MPTIQQSLAVLLPIAAKKTKHAHYDTVVKLVKEYYRPLSTGEGAEHLLQRFNLREDVEAFEQRKRLTQLITPSITSTLMAPVRKIPRVRPVVNTVKWATTDKKARDDGEEARKREQLLREAASAFHSGKGVDHYFGSVLLDQGAIDPNAFCLVLFGDFDARYEKPVPYPAIISCEDAWNFEYVNGELQWLVVHRPIKYEVVSTARPKKPKAGEPASEPVTKDGHAFWLYDATYQIMLMQVDGGRARTERIGVVVDGDGNELGQRAPVLDGKADYFYRVSKSELYRVSFYEHKAGMVQAFRLGFIPDQRTKGETCVNLWHSAMPHLLKGVKAGSEMDLSASLHAFLQKLSYDAPCPGEWRTDAGGNKSRRGCDGGFNEIGEKCKACGGAGKMIHQSGQDHISLAMPKNKEDAFDLASLTHYVPLPIEVLEWQDKYVDKLERACYRAVYNSDRFRPADASTTTATGDIIDLQSIYDTLKPAADWYSRSYVRLHRILASFVVGSTTVRELEVAHEFPRNMRFETTSERVKLLQDMRNAGASNGAMLQVDGAILEDLYIDDPAALRRAKTMARFNPFIGKAEGTVLSMMAMDLATREDKILWSNEARVYAICEQQAEEKGLDFYAMAEKEQRRMVDAVIAEIIERIDEQAPDPMPKAGLGVDETLDDDGDGDNDQEGNGLPASPGQSATR